MLKLIELKFQIIVVIEPKMFLIFRPKGEQNAYQFDFLTAYYYYHNNRQYTSFLSEDFR